MKYEKIALGGKYWTKVGKNWDMVTVTDRREALNVTLVERDRSVNVRTSKGNVVNRSVRQLHETHGI